MIRGFFSEHDHCNTVDWCQNIACLVEYIYIYILHIFYVDLPDVAVVYQKCPRSKKKRTRWAGVSKQRLGGTAHHHPLAERTNPTALRGVWRVVIIAIGGLKVSKYLKVSQSVKTCFLLVFHVGSSWIIHWVLYMFFLFFFFFFSRWVEIRVILLAVETAPLSKSQRAPKRKDILQWLLEHHEPQCAKINGTLQLICRK